MVNKALDNNFWIQQIDTTQGLTLPHVQEFVVLWEMIDGVALNPDRKDTISWKFTSSGDYSAATAYTAQFEGQVLSSTSPTIWRNWAPPKCKFFTWLIIQNRVWTADRLQRRGWPNCGLCPLCKQVQESAAHLLFQCRFTTRVWTEVVNWLGIQDHSPLTWRHEDTVQDWWLKTINTGGHIKKVVGSVLMIVMWESGRSET